MSDPLDRPPVALPEGPVVVLGAGSIGRRHARNLRRLGVETLISCDPDAERTAPLVAELGVATFGDWEEALARTTPAAVFVCTPPSLHVAQALRALEVGAHVFVEKPLSHSWDRVDELSEAARRAGRIVQVGYNLRFHPGLRRAKELLSSGAIGRPLWLRAEVGQHLPDWRPWQDYRKSYTARRDLGGGIVLDASHELDYVLWLLGTPVSVGCLAGHVSDLEVDVEDCATVLLRFADRAQADVHMDFVQRVASRACKIAGSEGTLELDLSSNRLRLSSPRAEPVEMATPGFSADAMYVDEVQHFLRCLTGEVEPLASVDQARETLRVALAARRAAEEMRWITLA